MRITPSRTYDDKRLDAVVIGGGTDVDPFHYGETRPVDEEERQDRQGSLLDWLVGLTLTISRAIFASHSVQDYDPDRDRLEKHLIELSLYRGLPVLGICRGAQLMNVVLGGSLHQDIGHFYTEETNNVRSILPRKAIAIQGDTLLERILQTGTCRVNALHDQSIKELGDGVVVSARENTGVIQAIERRQSAFFVGVQWHPEYMPQSTTQQRLFRDLIRYARRPATGESGDVRTSD
jgi:putative glutamine amidotransferase